MGTLFSFFASSLIFVALYQFLAPRFSKGAVTFQPVNFWNKLAFGAGMTVFTGVVTAVVALVSSVTVLPALVMLAGAGLRAVLPFVVFVLVVAVLQASHWLSTLVLGRLMPGIIRVDSSKAAFKGAWAPTLVFGLLYGLLLALLTAFGLALSQLQ